jgi:hypothetical protein
MRTPSPIPSLLGTVLLAAALAACATEPTPSLSTHEGAVANQEVTYIYYDCANPDVGIGWRFHACTATNTWSSGGERSACFEVDSQDCSNASPGTIQYCENSLCASWEFVESIVPYAEWARSN